MLSFKNTVAQWEIYDSYMAEYAVHVRTHTGLGRGGGGWKKMLNVSTHPARALWR